MTVRIYSPSQIANSRYVICYMICSLHPKSIKKPDKLNKRNQKDVKIQTSDSEKNGMKEKKITSVYEVHSKARIVIWSSWDSVLVAWLTLVTISSQHTVGYGKRWKEEYSFNDHLHQSNNGIRHYHFERDITYSNSMSMRWKLL